MHLVDAIRLAARKQAETVAEPTAEPVSAPQAEEESPMQYEELAQHEPPPLSTHPPEPIPQAKAPKPVQQPEPNTDPTPVSQAVAAGTGSVVRLELFLTPEQMHQLLRSILHGSHTVMTLREAAQFLRMKNDALRAMAESGDVPAFLVDGQWKFPRQGIEEWLTLQSLQNKDAA